MRISFEADSLEQIVDACRLLVQKFDDGSHPDLWKTAIVAAFMDAQDAGDQAAVDFYRDWFRAVA